MPRSLESPMLLSLLSRKRLNNMTKGSKLTERNKKLLREASSRRKEVFGYINSPETRKRLSLALKDLPRPGSQGINHYRWISDRTTLKISDNKGLDQRYREWSRSVKNRDKWECRIINKDCNGRLESHHILNWIDYPELRYEINNGITLCRAHHPIKWKDETELAPGFQKLVLDMK